MTDSAHDAAARVGAYLAAYEDECALRRVGERIVQREQRTTADPTDKQGD